MCSIRKRSTLSSKTTRCDVVVNLAAWANVDAAEPEKDDTNGTVYRLNVAFPGQLAEACLRLGKFLIHVSTDYVFDGTRVEAPYKELDATRALCWYAETKLRGEQAVLRADDNACVARIEMPFTAREHAKRDLARTIVARLQHGQTIQGVTDQRITPVFLDDAADALWRLTVARYAGPMHVAASDWTTPFAFATALAQRLGIAHRADRARELRTFFRDAARAQAATLVARRGAVHRPVRARNSQTRGRRAQRVDDAVAQLNTVKFCHESPCILETLKLRDSTLRD